MAMDADHADTLHDRRSVSGTDTTLGGCGPELGE